MPELNDLNDSFNAATMEPQKLPSGLNVLTILTFIGSAIQFITSLLSFVNGKKNLDKLEELQASGKMDEMPGFMKNFVGPDALEMTRKSYENRYGLLIVGLVAVALCVYGAIQMRQLKKTGFYVYSIGELLPLLVSVILVGMSTGWIVFSLLFCALFIGLYATQLKYMK